VNVRNKNLVEVLNEGTAIFTIATVTDDGYGRRRQVPAASFHDHYLADDGRKHTSGYVPVGSVPGDHLHAMKTELTRMEMLELIDAMTEAELADLILKQQRVMEEAKAVIDRAKTVSKSRRAEGGLEVHGDVAMIFSPDKKFDPATAARTLTQEQLLSISVPKPDATKAKKVLGEHSELYKACQKDNGLKLTVREATDADRLIVIAMSNPSDDESFELTDFPTS
jgi:hypothetical protein